MVGHRVGMQLYACAATFLFFVFSMQISCFSMMKIVAMILELLIECEQVIRVLLFRGACVVASSGESTP